MLRTSMEACVSRETAGPLIFHQTEMDIGMICIQCKTENFVTGLFDDCQFGFVCFRLVDCDLNIFAKMMK